MLVLDGMELGVGIIRFKAKHSSTKLTRKVGRQKGKNDCDEVCANVHDNKTILIPLYQNKLGQGCAKLRFNNSF